MVRSAVGGGRGGLAGVLVLVALAAASAAAGAGAQPLAERLPASTMVYLGWSPTAALQTTATAKMLGDERFMGPWRRVFQEFVLDLPDGADGGEMISAHLPPLLMDAAQCEGCFALLELKPDGRHLNPQSVLMIDLGAKRASFEEHFKPIHQRMKERVGERLKMMKLEKSWVYTKPDRDGRARLTWGFVGDTFVMFMGDGAEEFVPKLVKGRVEQNLQTAPAFVDAVGKVPAGAGQAVFTTYLDTKASLTLVRRLIERDAGADLQALLRNWDKLLTEVGLDNVRGLAEKTTIEERQFVTRSLLRTDGPPKGLLGYVTRPGVDERMLRAIPQDGMAAAAFRFDWGKGYEQVKQSLINLGGEDAKQAFDMLEQATGSAGLPLKPSLEALGDQWVVYNATSQGGFALTGWAVVNDVRDRAKLNKTLDALRVSLGRASFAGGERGRVRAIDADGVRVEYLEVGRWGSFFSPAWAVVGDRLVFAFYPQIVEDAVRHIKEGDKSLLDNPEFVAARRRTGAAGPMLYSSGPEVTKNLYPVALLFVSVINGMGGFDDGGAAGDEGAPPSTAELLPSMQRLLRYVGTDAMDVRATQDGVLKTRSVGNPLLSPMAWVDSPVVWLALGIPSLGAVEDSADREKSATNLRQVGQAIQVYSNENKGKFPPDLATLTRSNNLPPEATRSPFGPVKGGGDDVALILPAGANPMSTPGGHQVFVAYDRAALEQGDGTNVLYGDGHVEWMTPEAFRRGLEESKKKAAGLKPQP